LYFWPAPNTYTGQDLVEIHAISCSRLIDLLVAQLLQAGARSAEPGEFTLRAFLAGKLDLTQAEAVLAVVHAGSRQELKQALAQLAGGIAGPLESLRDDILSLLADVEAGLDFAEEDIHFIHRDELLQRLGRALAELGGLRTQLEARALADRPFRAVLVGKPNAGKSSLYNQLTGGSALVSAQPGTTRDYLISRLQIDDVPVELVDTAGWSSATSGIEGRARSQAAEQSQQADLLVLCSEAGQAEHYAADGRTLLVATKCDLAQPHTGHLATSAATGEGIGQLRRLLAEAARKYQAASLAPSTSRCQHHIGNSAMHLRRAVELLETDEGPELLALELRGAVHELGAMVGAVYTDDLLDRIFSRFCIGK
jgi:tRNA modification GTPase